MANLTQFCRIVDSEFCCIAVLQCSEAWSEEKWEHFHSQAKDAWSKLILAGSESTKNLQQWEIDALDESFAEFIVKWAQIEFSTYISIYNGKLYHTIRDE